MLRDDYAILLLSSIISFVSINFQLSKSEIIFMKPFRTKSHFYIGKNFIYNHTHFHYDFKVISFNLMSLKYKPTIPFNKVLKKVIEIMIGEKH